MSLAAALFAFSVIPVQFHDYVEALGRVRHGGSIERAYDAAVAAGEPLTDVLEDLRDADYNRVAAVKGLIVSRDEIIVAAPDPKFFLALAKKYGQAEDVAFFEELTRTTTGVWRSYIHDQTDVTGCTAFGEGELVNRYAGWLSFRRLHQGYAVHVRRELDAIEHEVAHGTCACGGREETLRELKEFVVRFPVTARRLHLERRIRDDKDISYHCHSG